MQALHITLNETLTPGPSKQRFLRNILTTVDKHGFGKEVWVVGYDSGTHVQSCTDASAITICTGGVYFVKHEGGGTTTTTVADSIWPRERIEQLETTAWGGNQIAANSLVVFLSADMMTPEMLAFLHTQRKVAAVATAAVGEVPRPPSSSSSSSSSSGAVSQQANVPAKKLSSPIPILYRCSDVALASLMQNSNGNMQNSTTTLILPLHYGTVSRNLLPSSCFTLPGSGSNKVVRLLKDCTQPVTDTSSTLKCGCLYNSQKALHFPGVGGVDGGGDCGAMLVSCDYGTHVDSPKHFYASQRSISDLTPSELFAPGVVIDISEKAAQNADAEVSLADVKAWEERNGRRIPDGALVCMRSGWSKRFNEGDESYANKDKDGVMHFPGFSAEAADFLASERCIAGLGVDTFSTDVGASTTYDVHYRILKESMYNVENLDLTSLPDGGFDFVTAPLRVEGAYEAPARCVAIISEATPEG